MHGTEMQGAQSLQSIVDEAHALEAVHKTELSSGDWVFVTTKNSTYAICALGDGSYSVSGGWFDRKGLSPQKVTINGCTWGGSAIKHDIVAACGLFLEFGNRVVTTRIRQVRVVRESEQPARN